jgi:hypothetical protein
MARSEEVGAGAARDGAESFRCYSRPPCVRETLPAGGTRRSTVPKVAPVWGERHEMQTDTAPVGRTGGHSNMVLSDLRDRLTELESVSAGLNQASDAFTEELKAIEAKLAKLNLGLEVEYTAQALYEGELREEHNRQTHEVELRYRHISYLAYGKTAVGDNRWALLVRNYRKVFLPDEEWEFILDSSQPLLNASRDVRLAAAEHLEGLLEEIKRKATAKLEALRKVTDQKN